MDNNFDSAQDRGEHAQIEIRADALHDGIQHIRTAKGVWDTFPETRDLVAGLEKYLKPLEKELKELDNKRAVLRQEKLQRVRRPSA